MGGPGTRIEKPLSYGLSREREELLLLHGRALGVGPTTEPVRLFAADDPVLDRRSPRRVMTAGLGVSNRCAAGSYIRRLVPSAISVEVRVA
jgi:hypothetical protein